MYRVNIVFGSEKIEVETHGVKDGEALNEFLAMLGPLLPRYIADFVDEHVKDEYQEAFLVQFLMEFIREYLDVTGLGMDNLAKFVIGERNESSTVH